MEKVANGLFVSVDYTGILEDGQVFDSSKGRSPLEVHMGAGEMIEGFEEALMGMGLSETKTFTITPERAYGLRDETLTRSFSRNQIPPQMEPQVGMTVALTTAKGQQVPAHIVHVDQEKVVVDLNHPLAGRSLTFDVKVVGISPTRTQTAEGSGCGCSCDEGCGGGSCSC